MRIVFFLLFILVSGYTAEPETERLPKADQVVVYKNKRQMHLLRSRKVIRTYIIALGDNPMGHKRQEGDKRTPEGNYVLDWRNSKSAYYKSIHISYPNQQDKENARRLGVSPGGDIMIHGMNRHTA